MRSLRIFEAAARNGSFAIAAQELFVTASAVSHQIKNLEQHLGVSLFVRNKRSVELTPTGEKYLVAIKQALNGIDVATQDITSNPNVDIVKIGVAPNFLVRWLMPHLHKFQSKYPDVELQIYTSDEPIDLTKSNTDMAVYFGLGDWHDLDVELLFKVSLLPVCSKLLLDNKHPLESPQDLLHYPLIHVTKRLYEWPEWLQISNIDYSGYQRGLQLSSSQLATTAAKENLGVALADRILSSREIDEGKLVTPFDIVLDTQRSFFLVHSKYSLVTYGMSVFKEWVLDAVHNDIAGAESGADKSK